MIQIFFFVELTTDCASVCKEQNLSCKITFPESQAITNTGVLTTVQESRQNKKGKIIKINFLQWCFLIIVSSLAL